MASELLTGCVKWFNHNLNYGFVTVLTDGEHNKADIFVHQSNIKTKNDCYRTLTPGECVQFNIEKSENSKHPIHAVNVTGFNGVMLNCETSRPRVRNFNGERGGIRGGTRGGTRGGNRGGNRGSDSNRSEYVRNGDEYNNRNSYNSNFPNNFSRQPYLSQDNTKLEGNNNTQESLNESLPFVTSGSETITSVNEELLNTTSTTNDNNANNANNATNATTTTNISKRGRGRGRGKAV